MSWKSIEMQVALPRTQDAGKLQEQMGKQHQHFQESLTRNQREQEEWKRKSVNEFECVKLLESKEEDHLPHLQEIEINREAEPLKESEHPYLGIKIDLHG